MSRLIQAVSLLRGAPESEAPLWAASRWNWGQSPAVSALTPVAMRADINTATAHAARAPGFFVAFIIHNLLYYLNHQKHTPGPDLW